MTEQTVFLNGDYVPISKAKVSVLDRGFIFGDGVYEVIPVYGGKLFRFEEHMQRLQDSLDAIRLSNPYTLDEWQNLLSRLLPEEKQFDHSIYLQLTRGVAPRDHSFPVETQPTVFAMANRLPRPDPIWLKQGVEAVTLQDNRWLHCNIKSIALLANVLLRQQAMDQQAMEAILIRDSVVTEGAASNVFIVQNGTVKTPVKDHHLLPGITRDLIVELARDNGLACEECQIPESALLEADEVWLSSSTKEILPVTLLNQQPVGTGKPGPIWQKMYTIFQEYKDGLRQSA
ncbi:MAG: D-amino-acid transaminase [Gammaproteobacteria bacterium]|nr:D-amino-acid transaminase [Gammaproteobacteria bacterium]